MYDLSAGLSAQATDRPCKRTPSHLIDSAQGSFFQRISLKSEFFRVPALYRFLCFSRASFPFAFRQLFIRHFPVSACCFFFNAASVRLYFLCAAFVSAAPVYICSSCRICQRLIVVLFAAKSRRCPGLPKLIVTVLLSAEESALSGLSRRLIVTALFCSEESRRWSG